MGGSAPGHLNNPLVGSFKSFRYPMRRSPHVRAAFEFDRVNGSDPHKTWPQPDRG
jgi:hypothetical protein